MKRFRTYEILIWNASTVKSVWENISLLVRGPVVKPIPVDSTFKNYSYPAMDAGKVEKGCRT